MMRKRLIYIILPLLLAVAAEPSASDKPISNITISVSATTAEIMHREWRLNMWRYILPEHVFPAWDATQIEPNSPVWGQDRFEMSGRVVGVEPATYRIVLLPGQDVVDLEMSITNTGSTAWLPSAFAVLCLRHIGARDFIDMDRGRTFIHADGAFVAVKDTDPNFEHSGHLLRGEDLEWASDAERKTYLDGRPLADASLIVRSSRDDKRHVAIAWESARSVSYNLDERYNCNHSQPRFGPLPPGKSVTVRGRLYFFAGTREALFAQFESDFPDRGYRDMKWIEAVDVAE